MNFLERLLEKYKERGELIKLLQEIQDSYGYLPIEVLKIIAEKTKIFPAEIFGIATFYSHFRFIPQGRHLIKACHGTACFVSGAEKISSALEELLKIKEKETTKDGLFSLDKVACLGCCSLAPCIMIDKKVYGRLKTKDIEKILKDYK
ncbi:MAG: NADH-quinone oxidoreductase subunit NuoE [bacterium]